MVDSVGEDRAEPHSLGESYISKETNQKSREKKATHWKPHSQEEQASEDEYSHL